MENNFDKEVRALYKTLHQLEKDPSKNGEYQRVLAHLRDIQMDEALRIRAEKETHLSMAPGEGHAALQKADELIAKYKHLADPK